MAVRWLDDAEQQTWRAFIFAQRMLFDQLDRELQRDAGMPHAYYMILAVLSEHSEQRMRMSELADILGSSRSRLSHAVARLEEWGWVERVSDPADGRGQVAQLTAKGYTAIDDASAGHVEGVRTHLFDQLTPTQVRQLRRISEAIVEHLNTVD